MRVTTSRDPNTFYKETVRKDLCVICGKKNILAQRRREMVRGRKRTVKFKKLMTMTIDHLVPKRLQGQSHWMNYAPMCDNCNGALKGPRSLLEAMLRRSDKRLCQMPVLDSTQSINFDRSPLPRDWFYPLFGLLDTADQS